MKGIFMNPTNEKIKQILDDLYDLDPEFRNHEDRLEQIISELLRARPNISIDANFADQLRRKLVAKSSLMSMEHDHVRFFKKNIFIFSGAALITVMALVGGGYYLQKLSTNKTLLFSGENQKLNLFASSVNISKIGSNAFGTIQPAGAGMGGASSRPQNGGGGGAAADVVNTVVPSAASSMAYGKDMGGDGMIVPYTNYRYVYKGEEFTVPEGNMDVLRKVKGFSTGVDAAGLLRQLNFGLVNIDSFNNMKLQNLTLAEDKEYGYTFYVSLQDGLISISENWLKWPNPFLNCQDESCYQVARLKLSEVPDDVTVISLANQFLAEHNISQENYGEPVINSSWRHEYEKVTDKSQFYIPNAVSVIYPLKLNDKEVYDEGGNKIGLSVNINARSKKVSSINDLSSQNYESSSYPADTNIDELLKRAEQGGYFGGTHTDPAANTQDVQLGTPTISYLRAWQYRNGLNDELYVPALIFPVTQMPQGQYFYRQSVVVPLVKGLLQDNSGGPIQIMDK